MQVKQRVDWLDFIKGIAAMMVILSHTPGTPQLYQSIISFVMIPVFFIASGYVNKASEPGEIGQFLYNRVLKLLILYIVYCYLIVFSSISELKNFIHEGGLLETLRNVAVNDILQGKGFWFVSCMISVTVIFAILNAVSNRRNMLLFILSLTLGIIGIALSYTGISIPWWYFDRSLVCQFFYVCGYFMREYNLPKEEMCKLKYIFLFGTVYLAILIVSHIITGGTEAYINVAKNTWGNLFITVPAMLSGNIFMILLSTKIDRVKLISYIGQHSLIYFAFASHAMSVANKGFAVIFKLTGLAVFENRYIINPIICILASVIMIIPCLFIDKFLPFLNGKFKLPQIKKSA